MMTKASGTTADDNDEKVNDKLNFSSDWQRKLEATNKSILSALIQHKEEQKDEKKEMKMLHLLHELPIDTETKEELINDVKAVVSDCSVVAETKAETKDTDKDMLDEEEDDTADAKENENEKKIGE